MILPTTHTKGALTLTFDRVGGVTRLSVQEQRAPLQVVRAFNNPDGSALVHLHNISGGVLAGDDLSTRVTVGPGAVAQLTTTGATRLYRHREGQAVARQTFQVEVGPGGWLEYLPDNLIPFAGSRYCQRSQIELASGAGVFWWEMVAAGRVAAGEAFAYEQLELDLAITQADQPLVLDRARLAPARRSLAQVARLGPFNYLASCYICQVFEPPHPAFWLNLEREVAEWLATRHRPGESEWGASALARHGLSIRGLSRSGREVLPTLLDLWQYLRPKLVGQACPLPRKVY